MGEMHFAQARRAFEEGKAAVERADWERAIVALERALLQEPGYAEVYPFLMQAAMAREDYLLAGRVLLQVAEHAPKALPAVEHYLSGRYSKRQSRSHVAASPSGALAPVYQLKITLKYISPPVWRRVLVKRNNTLAKLHTIIQTVMGWYNCHLHQFETSEGLEYGVPDPEEDAFWGHGPLDERKVKLDQVLTAEKERLRYLYDFGDSWTHDILLEKLLPIEKEQHYPMCITGRRAVPPEDVGGVPGYANCLAALADPLHEEHALYVKWIGRDFNPEAFDLVGINEALRQIR